MREGNQPDRNKEREYERADVPPIQFKLKPRGGDSDEEDYRSEEKMDLLGVGDAIETCAHFIIKDLIGNHAYVHFIP